MTIVEKDMIEYSNGFNYVCSAYVASFYKQAGIFDGMTINPPEFTPKDVYSLKIFKDDPATRPASCKQADPKMPYCQLMGDWKVELDTYNSIDLYSNMNESCPTLAPLFIRTPGC